MLIVAELSQDVHNDAKAGLVAIVPSLGAPGGMNNGSVAIYGPKNELLSTIEVAKTIGHLGHQYVSLQPLTVLLVLAVSPRLGRVRDRQLNCRMRDRHPHDAMFLPNGDAVICCWGGPANTQPKQGPAKGTISYWKRVVNGGYGGMGFAGLPEN